MVQKIVFFGATGHIGGAVLDALLHEYLGELQVQALVRTQAQADRLTAQYPTVSCTVGRIEDHDIVENLSKDAHIVVNCAPDITHDADIKAILKGLSSRAPEKRGYYIHTSGATLIFHDDADSSSEGQHDEPTGEDDGRVWDDLHDIEEIKALSPKCTHAETDKIVRNAAPAVNVAIMSPGGVSGLSASQQHPMSMGSWVWGGAIRAYGGPFQIGPGKARCAAIHVRDLAAQFLILLRDALAPPNSSTPAPPFPMWGPDAYYFGVAQLPSYSELVRKQAEVMVKHDARLVRFTEPRTITVTEAARVTVAAQTGGEYDADAPLPPADSWIMHLAAAYGRSMKVKATRMERLGWTPTHEIDEDLAGEIAKCVELGLL